MTWDKQEEHNRGQRDANEGKNDPPFRGPGGFLTDSILGTHKDFDDAVKAYEKGHDSAERPK